MDAQAICKALIESGARLFPVIVPWLLLTSPGKLYWTGA